MARLPEAPRRPWAPPTPEDRARQQIRAEGRTERARLLRDHFHEREERVRREMQREEEARMREEQALRLQQEYGGGR